MQTLSHPHGASLPLSTLTQTSQPLRAFTTALEVMRSSMAHRHCPKATIIQNKAHVDCMTRWWCGKVDIGLPRSMVGSNRSIAQNNLLLTHYSFLSGIDNVPPLPFSPSFIDCIGLSLSHGKQGPQHSTTTTTLGSLLSTHNNDKTQIKLKDTKHQDHTAITSRLLHLASPKTKTTRQQSTIVYDIDGDKQTNRQSPSTSRLAVVIGKSLVDCGFERMQSFHLVCGGAREACGWLDQKESLHGWMERMVICLVGVVVLGGGIQTMERLVAAGFGGNRRFTMVRWGKGDMLVILGEGLNVHG